MILVNPSSRAAVIEVHYKSPGDEKGIKMKNEDELSCIAGETITGLSMYKIGLSMRFCKNSKSGKVMI